MLRDVLMLIFMLVAGILVEKRIRNLEARLGGDKERESRSQETDRKIEALRDAVSSLRIKLEELQRSNADLRGELQETKTGFKESEQQRLQQQNKIESIVKECKEDQESRNKFKETVVRLEKELQDSKSKNSEMNGQVKSLAEGLQKSTAMNKEVKDQIKLLESSLEKVKTTDRSLEDKVKNLDQVLGSVKSSDAEMKDKVNSLQKELSDINTARKELKTNIETLSKGRPVVAFHVVGTEQNQLGDSEVLKYSKTITNIGNGYDKGYFVAPVKGLYLLSMSAMSPKGNKLRVEMVKNGDHIADVYSGSTGEEMGSQTATVVLQAGEKAWVRHHPSQKEKEHLTPDTFNSFSGLLISTDV